MDIQQGAYLAGAASARALADEMKRRGLMRQLDTIQERNPGALDQMLAPRQTPSMRGGGARVGFGGTVSGDANAAFNERWNANNGTTPGSTGLENFTGAGGWAAQEKAYQQKLAAPDMAGVEAEKAYNARNMERAYGATGGYGQGIAGPGLKPGEAAPGFEQALALKLAGQRAPAAAKGQDFAAIKARVDGLEAVAASRPDMMTGQLAAELATKKAILAGQPAQGGPQTAPPPTPAGPPGFSGTLPDATAFGTNRPEVGAIPALMAKFGTQAIPGSAPLASAAEKNAAARSGAPVVAASASSPAAKTSGAGAPAKSLDEAFKADLAASKKPTGEKSGGTGEAKAAEKPGTSPSGAKGSEPAKTNRTSTAAKGGSSGKRSGGSK